MINHVLVLLYIKLTNIINIMGVLTMIIIPLIMGVLYHGIIMGVIPLDTYYYIGYIIHPLLTMMNPFL